MATDKVFAVAGISKHKGEYKVRFANDFASRIKALMKNGHEDIRLAQLDEPKTKIEAVRELLTSEGFEDTVAQDTLRWYLDENAPKTTKAGPAVTRTSKVQAPILEDEDVPF